MNRNLSEQIVRIIQTSARPRENLEKMSTQTNITPTILRLIKNAVSVDEAKNVIRATPEPVLVNVSKNQSVSQNRRQLASDELAKRLANVVRTSVGPNAGAKPKGVNVAVGPNAGPKGVNVAVGPNTGPKGVNVAVGPNAGEKPVNASVAAQKKSFLNRFRERFGRTNKNTNLKNANVAAQKKSLWNRIKERLVFKPDNGQWRSYREKSRGVNVSNQRKENLLRRMYDERSRSESDRLRENLMRRMYDERSRSELNQLRAKLLSKPKNEDWPSKWYREKPRNRVNSGTQTELVPSEKRAINNVGGVQKAVENIASVPGGVTSVKMAARNITGSANIAAVQAVHKLGGPKNTLLVLSGLEKTRKRKAARYIARPKKRPARIHVKELDKVINSVKKQKLISRVAHNVTKTNNIHPEHEKLKAYYKKVIKSNILNTPFSKIVKKAALKKMRTKKGKK